MPEGLLEAPAALVVAFLVWLAVRLSRALRSRDVDYSRAMEADMEQRELEAQRQKRPAPPRAPDRLE